MNKLYELINKLSIYNIVIKKIISNKSNEYINDLIFILTKYKSSIQDFLIDYDTNNKSEEELKKNISDIILINDKIKENYINISFTFITKEEIKQFEEIEDILIFIKESDNFFF